MSRLPDKIAATFQKIHERGNDGVWISLVPVQQALERASALQNDSRQLPLKGQTFAIKDNIDLEGLPTTAACPAFAYTPAKSAFVVERLINAGAIPIGKTNLDQFATGLNGTRSPYGFPRNFYNPDFISGGSSSGSAIAVAADLTDFALGTDTAGSGRVPAAFNNLVGLKPTRGSWSTTGSVPACRTLDCITVLSKTVDEAERVDRVAKGFDPEDPYSRNSHVSSESSSLRRVGVLGGDELEFFGDTEYSDLYAAALEQIAALGWSLGQFDFGPFREAADLLYHGPWLAERYGAAKPLIETRPDLLHPVVRGIILDGTKFSAVDAFESQYRLAALGREAERTWEAFDAILLPSAGTIYTVSEMLADPIQLNTNLGRYTNFMNLLDLCGLAMPAGFRSDNVPFGITLCARAWREPLLFELAREFEARQMQTEIR